MSKRKSILVANSSEDFAFEDQEMEFESAPTSGQKKARLNSQNSSAATITNLSNTSSRVSGRQKKIKSIYDPSENQKPINKRKKDGQEGEKSRNSSVSESIKLAPPSPVKVKSQEQSSKPSTPAPEAVKGVTKSKIDKFALKTAVISIPRLITNGKTVEKPRKSSSAQVTTTPTASTAATAVKEPSKRLQEKKKKVSLPDTTTNDKKSAAIETLSVKSNSNGHSSDAIPDVRTWSEKDVSEYFHTKLGFSKKESAIFRDEEIDGEALMIMKRTDVVNNKFPQIKLGTAIKFWSQILRLQTKSNDPTQAWN